jgi:small subunit ribosomal protein S18
MARERRSNSKSAAADRRRPQKKKISILNTEQVEWIDYKDVNLLRRFMSERAKIRARRVTGNSAQQQREVAKAIRVAREMALLPYSVRQVTQRKGGGRRERGDRDLREATPPRPEATEELGEGVTVDEAVVTDEGVGAEAVMVETLEVETAEVEVEVAAISAESVFSAESVGEES